MGRFGSGERGRHGLAAHAAHSGGTVRRERANREAAYGINVFCQRLLLVPTGCSLDDEDLLASVTAEGAESQRLRR